jgi:response regulator RpfG family c-di-GMP phosphodiesterase
MDTVQSSAGNHFEPRLVALFVGILPQILAIQAEWDRPLQK